MWVMRSLLSGHPRPALQEGALSGDGDGIGEPRQVADAKSFFEAK